MKKEIVSNNSPQNLPFEVVAHIFSFLAEPKYLAVLERVSKNWNEWVIKNGWKNVVKNELTNRQIIFSEGMSYKEYYKLICEAFLKQIKDLLVDGKINQAEVYLFTFRQLKKFINIYDYDYELDRYNYLLEDNEHFKLEKGDEYKFTPLSCAVRAGFEKLALFLLNNGADVNSHNTFTRHNPSDFDRGYPDKEESISSPLHEAVMFKQIDCIKLLLARNSRINEYSLFGGPPICIAIRSQNSELVKLLINSGADVNSILFPSGDTPLHVAVKTGNKKIIRILLDNGAKDNPDEDGKKPSELAEDKGFDLFNLSSDEDDNENDVESVLNSL